MLMAMMAMVYDGFDGGGDVRRCVMMDDCADGGDVWWWVRMDGDDAAF